MVLRPQGLLPERRRKLELTEGIGARPSSDGDAAPVSRAGHGHGRPRRRRPHRRSCAPSTWSRSSAASSRSNDVSFEIPTALDRLDHRAQRRRQDDVLQHAHRPLQADPRADPRSTTRHHPQAARRDHRAGGRAHVPEHPPVRRDERARERDGRPPLAHAGRAVRLDPAAAVGAARGARRSASTARELLAYVGLQPEHLRPARRPTSPTATSAGWRSPARSPPSRSCCCSTSRPPA